MPNHSEKAHSNQYHKHHIKQLKPSLETHLSEENFGVFSLVQTLTEIMGGSPNVFHLCLQITVCSYSIFQLPVSTDLTPF